MASTDPENVMLPVSEPPVPVTETPMPVSRKFGMATEAPSARASRGHFAMGDLVLRGLLFAASLTAVLVMVTSKETKMMRMPIPPFFPIVPRSAKWQHSSAFIYFVVALSFAGVYSIISGVLSFLAMLRPRSSSDTTTPHFLIMDALMLGIIASATGASGAVAYIGLKGNSYVNWGKICHVYGNFCNYIGASTFIALFASIVLALLVIRSASSLSNRNPK